MYQLMRMYRYLYLNTANIVHVYHNINFQYNGISITETLTAAAKT